MNNYGAHAMPSEFLHISQRMMENPLRAAEIAEKGVSRLPPFVRDGKPSTYRCRPARRTKASVKAAKRARMANRMLHFRALCWWCSGNTAWLVTP